MKQHRTLPQILAGLLVMGLVVSSGTFAAPYACTNPKASPAGCQMDPYKQQACTQACNAAKSACDAAGKACDAAKAGEEAANQQANQGSNQAANSSNGNQGVDGSGGGGTQAPNAANMCNGSDASKKAGDAGQPVPPAMQRCKAAAQQCQGLGGNGQKAMGDADASIADMAPKIAQHLANAGQMAGKCDQSKENESKMPQMQPPQPPEKKGGDEGKDPFATDTSTLASGTDTDTDTSTTVQVESVNFGTDDIGDNGGTGGVSALPGSGPSAISGNTPAGSWAGAGAPGPQDTGRGGFGDNSLSPQVGTTGSQGSGGASSLGGGGGSGASKSKDGIAAADIRPESGGGAGYEVNLGGGKSILGVGGGSGGEEITTAELAGIPSKSSHGSADKGGLRGPAGGGLGLGAAGATGADDGSASLFQMVHTRYKELRKVGSI